MASNRAPQSATLHTDGQRCTVDLRNPHDLAIALDFDERQPRWFAAPPAHSTPTANGEFSGQVQNWRQLQLQHGDAHTAL